jgi:hypothetical protein
LTRSAHRTFPRGRARAAGALALSALALAGCGGGSSSKPSASHKSDTFPATSTAATARSTPKHAKPGPGHPNPPAKAHPKHGPGGAPAALGPELTVAELERKADAACSSANARQAALSRPGDFATNSKAAAAYLGQLASIKASETSALHLNPAPSLGTRYDRFFTDMLREQSFLIVSAGQAQTGQHGYLKSYEAAVSYGRSVTAPAARQMNLSGCS